MAYSALLLRILLHLLRRKCREHVLQFVNGHRHEAHEGLVRRLVGGRGVGSGQEINDEYKKQEIDHRKTERTSSGQISWCG